MRKRALQSALSVMVTIISLLIVLLIVAPRSILLLDLNTIVMTLVVVCFVSFFPAVSAARSEASLQIIIEDDSIARFQNGHRLAIIAKKDIREIVEFLDEGTLVKSSSRLTTILVPIQLNGYDDIRSILATWCSITVKPSRQLFAFLSRREPSSD
jgi:hypothetical protein